MRCPYCLTSETHVTDSREMGRGVRRRRECDECGQRFTTHESPEQPRILVAKRDGRLQEYDRQKLARSIRSACFKRPTTAEDVERVVDQIEAELSGDGESRVQSAHIGQIALRKLGDFDEIAYLRFAIGQRPLTNADDVLVEIDVLRAAQQRAAQGRVQLKLQFDQEQAHWN